MSRPTRALLVGAGAVGQVFGRCLQRGGVEVGFFVKPAHLPACRTGFALYDLGRRKGLRWRSDRFGADRLLTTPEEVAALHWDQLWLCVSSTALRAGAWLDPLLRAAGEAALVNTTPGFEDQQLIAESFPEQRLVQALTTFLAYQTPLEGADEPTPEPGVAYWFPPLVRVPLGGQAELVAPVVAALRRGGCPAKRGGDVARQGGFAAALMMAWVAGLELADWRFRRFRRDRALQRLAFEASREATAVIADFHGARPPVLNRLIRPGVIDLVTRLGPRLAPLDPEAYIRYHFRKVGDQTRHALQRYAARARRRGLRHSALAELSERLGPAG